VQRGREKEIWGDVQRLQTQQALLNLEKPISEKKKKINK
jgi:hypothetical protein